MSCMVLIFAKAPIPGQVKTRLQPVLSPPQAAELHRRLLHCVLAVVEQSGLACWLFGGAESDELTDLCQQRDIGLSLQRGADLGERMFNAAVDGLQRNRSVLIIGSDCPFLTASHCHSAEQALREHDVVLIPATDGGYVLIGFAGQVDHRVFAGVDWGTSSVLEQTLRNLRELKLSWVELEPLADIDRPEDLQLLQRTHPALLADL